MEKTENINKGIISATAMKFIAIIAMTLDHYEWLFPSTDLKIYVIFHFIGRLTAPLMCFFITEGYHYTRDLKRYFTRLAIFAVISQAPFMFFYKTAFGVMNTGSMIITLLICLMTVFLMRSDKVDNAVRFPAILLLLIAVRFCDWGTDAVYFTICFELARDSGKLKKIASYIVVCLIILIPVIKLLVTSFSENWYLMYNLGILLPAHVLLLYNGKRGGSNSPKLKTLSKYFFYAYYPVHIFILSFISYNMNKG